MKEKKQRGKWSVWKITGIVLLVFLVIVAVYVGYVLTSYKRIEDNIVLEVSQGKNSVSGEEAGGGLLMEEEYSIITYNIGFGAYVPSFSFFMDGGKSSVGESRESVAGAVNGAASYVKEWNPDFILWQEVDLDATRSYHMDQYEMLKNHFPEYTTVFAINYDSAFLFYPITEPHGKSKAGIGTFSLFDVEGGIRRSLPISTSFSKFFDLDRCYSISRIPVENGKELCIFNIHMSAYGNDERIREGQIAMFCEDMKKEYEAGNYVICGGDFNHDLKAAGGVADTNTLSWAYPFPRESLPQGFSFALDLISKEEKESLWDSARNADIPYVEGDTFTITLDGFILSENIKCLVYENKNTGYAYSDHEPVYMKFLLDNTGR